MDEQQLNYQSYLIRIWFVEDNEQPVWRATLENANTGERLGFSTMKGLLEYLDSTAELMSHRATIARKKKSH